MPAYNAAEFLQDALAGVWQQTYPHFELIVIDDGSTDRTPELLAECNDPRLVAVRHDTNQGLSLALNTGLQRAQGEYVARMDADDVSVPARLARQLTFLDAHPAIGLVGARVQPIDENGVNCGDAPSVPESTGLIHFLLPLANCINHPTVMARRSVLMSCGGYDSSTYPADDYDLWLRVAERTDVANQGDVLVGYRQHGGSVTSWWAREGGSLWPEEAAAHRSLQRSGGSPVDFDAFLLARRGGFAADDPISTDQILAAISILSDLSRQARRRACDGDDHRCIDAELERRYLQLALKVLHHDPRSIGRVWRSAPFRRSTAVVGLARSAIARFHALHPSRGSAVDRPRRRAPATES